MDKFTKMHFENLKSGQRQLRDSSFLHLCNLANQPVSWVYEVWDELVMLLRTTDTYYQYIASELLIHLAKSDSANRMNKTIEELIDTSYRSLTVARCILQSMWKIAIVKPEFLRLVLNRLTQRFKTAIKGKNDVTIRADIILTLRIIYDLLNDSSVKYLAFELIQLEIIPRNQKRYLRNWENLQKPDSNSS